MSNKKYTIDGRDPNAKGYVNENRKANQQETDKIVEALESFGYKDVEGYKFHLFGRLDDVHGWYLFGISKEDDKREDFLILGDCLDVLEEPYNKVVGLDEVLQFARFFGSGENIGTAYDAMQTWGVFNSLSQGFCDMMDSIDVCIENERAHWDDKRKEWKVSYDVMFDTGMGGNEMVTITIPAQLGNSDDADREFMSEWIGVCNAYNADERYKDYLTVNRQDYVSEAKIWAESKERELQKIREAIMEYLGEGKPEKCGNGNKRDNRVWVLTIYKDEQFFPCVHKSLEGAIDTAIADMKEGMEDEEDYNFPFISKVLYKQMYWKDELSGAVYDIADCKVFA